MILLQNQYLIGLGLIKCNCQIMSRLLQHMIKIILEKMVYLKKYLLYGFILTSLYSCNSGVGYGQDQYVCPINAPLFSTAIGTTLINQWGVNALFYSPYGGAGYTDSYVGAAYFTGTEYVSNAVLLPTVSPITRSGSQEIYDYFTKFLAHGPQMTNNPGTPESGGPFISLAGCGYGVISGYYNFTYQDGTPTTTARYTFQFQYQSIESNISIVVESGSKYGDIITVKQPIGWYIKLQNSGKLPSSFGLPNNLLIK